MKWFRFCTHLTYFETGYGKTNYIKYLIALFGLSSLDISTTMWAAFFYAIICYFVGRMWYLKGFAIAQQEVSNKFNLFVKQMRKQKV